jgi:hypothetical protein
MSARSHDDLSLKLTIDHPLSAGVHQTCQGRSLQDARTAALK